MILGSLTIAAYATTYCWPSTKRPLISLEKAHAIASKRAGEHVKDSYCIGAYLMGNKAQDGKEGAWNFDYRSEDGAYFYVSVHMDGKVSVQSDSE